MASESGWNNQKQIGKANFKSINSVGSDKFGAPVIQKALYDVAPPAAIEDIFVIPLRPNYVQIEISDHGARVNDVLRIMDGAAVSWELDIAEIADSDNLIVANIFQTLPQIGDEAKVMRWITPRLDSDGNVSVNVSVNTAGLATEAKQNDIISSLIDIETELQALNGVDFATETKQNDIIAELQNIVTSLSGSVVGVYEEILNLEADEQIFVAPAGAKNFSIMADDTNTEKIRFKVGGSATIASGMQLQPGRSESFDFVGDISVIAEAGTNQKVYVQWGVAV
ncbi:MAG: hypothetical protein QXX57_03060 [Nitrososphaerota archaeon]